MSEEKAEKNDVQVADLPEAFLTANQRWEAVADIISDITLRIIKKRYEGKLHNEKS